MKRATKIWRYKLEEYIRDLYFEQRKTYAEISDFLKEKEINISRESIRNFINNELLHEKTTV